jgi:hypothetical protein
VEAESEGAMPRSILNSIAALGLILSCGAAEAKPSDFVGTWLMDMSRSTAAGQAAPISKITLIVSSSPTVITIERRDATTDRVIHYKLDGTDTLSSFGTDSATGKAQWDGDKLITTTDYSIRGIAFKEKKIHTLSSDGHELTVDTDLVVAHGYEGNIPHPTSSDPNHSVGKDVYVRQ